MEQPPQRSLQMKWKEPTERAAAAGTRQTNQQASTRCGRAHRGASGHPCCSLAPHPTSPLAEPLSD